MEVTAGIHCGEFSFCARCEKCVCKRFIKGIESWFLPMSYQQKLAFFLGLLKRCNTTLIGCLMSSIKVSEGKEKIYRFSKTNPQLDDMNEPPLRGGGFARQDLNVSMMNVFLEFLTFTNYQKKMVFLHFFRLSEDRLLASLSSQMYNIVLRDGIPDQFERSESSSDSEATSASEQVAEEPPASTTPVTSEPKREERQHVNLDDVHDTEPMSNYESEDDGFAFEDDFETETLTTRPTSSLKTTSPRPSSGKSSRRQKKQQRTTTASTTISIYNEKSGKDFISALPVGIAKKVFGYFDPATLANCLCVSSVWRQLGEEVRTEIRVQSEVTASVKLMQGTTGQLCNHRYARFVDVHVPNFDVDTGAVIANPKLKPVEENSHIYVEAFSHVSTRKVIMEERNVYCGPFNVMVVCDLVDKHRVIHNDGGNLIATGSRNRKITLHDITTGQELATVLEGHSGSVRCIHISTADNLVFSGSYDTGIRVWDLNAGKFTKVFNGHQATVLCLAYENQLIVSGSVDRTCRVWSLKSLKCIRKFYHRSAVTAVAIRTAYMEERIVSGDVKGHIKVWNLRTGRLIKVLHGHSGEVACIDLDKWFIISGSKDNYLMGWSNQGNHKRCLFAFAHPNHVLSVSLRYLRAVSGCGDGRIRIWSILNGNCVKVLRGNSRNDPILSMACRDNMMTINTESNVIVMKYEPIKFNYTTSELYLPDSSLKAKNAKAIAVSDSELNRLDSNGDPIGGHASRPHSAVRATRMHILQCASREISGSRSSLRSISPARDRSVTPETPRGTVSSMSHFRRYNRTRSASSTSTLKTRPQSSPTFSSKRQRVRNSRQSARFQEATFLQNPETITSILDHRCYPLRHRDLEEARRIQYASTLPPWRKNEVDDILKEVRAEHRRLVEKRRALRQQRAEQKKLAELAAVEAKKQSEAESTDGETDEGGATARAEVEEDKKMMRRMTWAFHRAQVKSASTYSGGVTPLGELAGDEDGVKPIIQPAPPAPPLEATLLDLRKTLIPGRTTPSLPFIRVSVSEVMRQNKTDLTIAPPLHVVPTPPEGLGQRHNSLSQQDKSSILTPTKEKRLSKQQPIITSQDARFAQQQQQIGGKRPVSSAQRLRKILLQHQKETELANRDKRSNSAPKIKPLPDEEELSPAELAQREQQRLLEMATKIEAGGWGDKQGVFIKEVTKQPVTVCIRPSPVAQTIFHENISTSVPRPFEILTEKQRILSAGLKKPQLEKIKRKIRTSKPTSAPEHLVTGSGKISSEPLMRVQNYESLLEDVRRKAESVRVEHARESQRKATAQFDYRLLASEEQPPPAGTTSRPSTAVTTSSALRLIGSNCSLEGPKPFVLHNPAVYDRQTAELCEMNAQEMMRKQERLEKWRQKRWSLLATGKLTANQIHDVGP